MRKKVLCRALVMALSGFLPSDAQVEGWILGVN